MDAPTAALITLTCPGCGAAYQVPAAKISAKGRKMKCASCATVWVAMPLEAPALATSAAIADTSTSPVAEVSPTIQVAVAPDPTPATIAAPAMQTEAVAPPAMDELTKPAWHKWVLGEQKWMSLAFILAAFGLVGGALGLWQQLYPSAPLALADKSLAKVRQTQVVAPPLGVVLHAMGAATNLSGTEVVLTLTGRIANTTKLPTPLPSLQAELVDEAGAVQDFWPVALITTTLPPQTEMGFSVTFSNPVASGWRLNWVR